ncbi:MAG: hypothetical protein ACTSX4_12090 [Candidatus Helarchaeota archaeon]
MVDISQKYKAKTINIDEVLKWKSRNYFMYFNYDNEAFMNTGIQESGSTPFYASTTTGPGGKKVPGKVGIKQDIIDGFSFLGMKSAFLATASTSYPQDFMGKVIEAMKTPGVSFIQVLASCNRGWRHPINVTYKVNKLAVDSGFWPLYTVRIKDGQPTYALNRKIQFDKTKELFTEYLKLNGRFRHIVKPFDEPKINDIIDMIHARAKNILGLVEQFGDPEYKMNLYKLDIKKIPNREILAPGHGLCQGCGAGIALNQLSLAAHTVAGTNLIITNNTSCSEVSLSKDDVPNWKVPWVHHLFETAATTADAIATTYRILKTKGLYKGELPYVIAIGGDGSTYDIGFQFLKSALVRAGSWGIMNDILAKE